MEFLHQIHFATYLRSENSSLPLIEQLYRRTTPLAVVREMHISFTSSTTILLSNFPALPHEMKQFLCNRYHRYTKISPIQRQVLLRVNSYCYTMSRYTIRFSICINEWNHWTICVTFIMSSLVGPSCQPITSDICGTFNTICLIISQVIFQSKFYGDNSTVKSK